MAAGGVSPERRLRSWTVGRRAAAVVVEVIQVDDAPGHSPFGPASYGRHPFDDAPGHGPSGRRAGGDRRSWAALGATGTRAGADGPMPRPRHITLVGLGAVVAVVVLVALVAGGSSTPAPPTAATIPPMTTLPARPAATITPPRPVAPAPEAVAATAASAGTVPGQAAGSGPPLAKLYLPDLPAAYAVTSADQTYPYRPAPTREVQQLWSDRAAGAARPRWLRIDASDDRQFGRGWGSARVSTVHGVAVVTANDFGGVSLVGPISGGGAGVTSSGLTLAEVLAATDGAIFVDGTVRFLPAAMPADLRMVAGGPTTAGGQSAVLGPFDYATMTLAYANVTDPGTSLLIDSTAGETRFEHVWDDYTVPVRREVDLGGGRTATVRATTSSGQAWSWVDVDVGDETFRISGSAPVADAITAARTLHPVGAGQWTPLQDLAGRNREANPVSWYTMYRDVASGTVGDRPWKVLSARGAEIQPDSYLVTIGEDTDLAVPEADVPGVRAVADDAATVVVGTAPASQPGAVLRVTVGTETFVTPLAAPDDGGNLVGVVAFTSLGVASAEVVDTGGKVLATLPSPTN